MNTELKAAQTLLGLGVALGIKPPLFLWFWKPKIYQPSIGNLIRMSKVFLETGIQDTDLQNPSIPNAHELMQKNAYSMCRIIAYTMTKGNWMPRLTNRAIGYWLMHKLTPQEVCAISERLILNTGIADFLNTTRYLKSKTVTGYLGQRANRS